MNIALFGTSGDPPTKGHQKILQWLSDRYDLCAVWVSNNPFKFHQTNLDHRVEMMRLLIAELNLTLGYAPDYFQDDYKVQLHPEISSPRSLVTLNHAKQIWQNAEFTLVVGSDLVSQLPSWYKAEELLQQVKILVVERIGYEVSEQILESLYTMGAKVAIADLVIPEVSSSNFRQNGDLSGIIPSIQEYINLHNLYQNSYK
jgi:nicotinate-nucleotide adenylyltransferase